jgi:hypothetical protein
MPFDVAKLMLTKERLNGVDVVVYAVHMEEHLRQTRGEFIL